MPEMVHRWHRGGPAAGTKRKRRARYAVKARVGRHEDEIVGDHEADIEGDELGETAIAGDPGNGESGDGEYDQMPREVAVGSRHNAAGSGRASQLFFIPTQI